MHRTASSCKKAFSSPPGTALVLALTLATTGCLGPLMQRSVALASATTPVIDEASATYRDVESLHDLRVDSDAVTQFDQSVPVYNPRATQPLLSEKDIQVRLAVLLAFQVYSKSLVEITSGVSSPALDAASKSVGSTLTTLGNDVAPSLDAVLHLPTPTASSTETEVVTTGGATTSSTIATITPANALSPAAQSGISAAVNALGQFLVARKIKHELPAKIEAMDPHLQTLCQLFEKDIDLLQDQETRDSNSLINQQTFFIRQSGQADHPALNPEQRRQLIMQLPGIVRKQRRTDAELAQLRASLVQLAQTHHALAAASHDRGSLKDNLASLSAAGDNLGKFYSSLPAR